MNSFRLPFFQELRPAKNILIAGAGGGFDVFSGLPLYFNLRAAGKNVHLANLSFTRHLEAETAGRHLAPELTEVAADSEVWGSYFPEKHLAEWFRGQGKSVPVYCFNRTGPKVLANCYRVLVELHDIDTIILVDGGTDSLLRGDEADLGTPEEDMASIAAVDQVAVARKMLVCLGFGIDAFHGVCHAHVLEGVADLIRAGGYLGAFSLLLSMPEVQQFQEATEYVLKQMPDRQSIVCTSILSALEGRFGDHHRTERTWGSQLFINPLMAFYWCFRLEQVARRVQYLTGMGDIVTWDELQMHIARFRAARADERRQPRELPM